MRPFFVLGIGRNVFRAVSLLTLLAFLSGTLALPTKSEAFDLYLNGVPVNIGTSGKIDTPPQEPSYELEDKVKVPEKNSNPLGIEKSSGLKSYSTPPKAGWTPLQIIGAIVLGTVGVGLARDWVAHQNHKKDDKEKVQNEANNSSNSSSSSSGSSSGGSSPPPSGGDPPPGGGGDPGGP